MLSLPLPNRSTVSTHPAAAPGTVTACTLSIGILPSAAGAGASPRSARMRSSVACWLARPDPLSADTRPVAAS